MSCLLRLIPKLKSPTKSSTQALRNSEISAFILRNCVQEWSGRASEVLDSQVCGLAASPRESAGGSEKLAEYGWKPHRVFLG